MIPVILDTDIGIDIDDHWAVAMVLGSPEFDLRLITVSAGHLDYRANLLTQLLVEAGRTDVPIALGSGDPPALSPMLTSLQPMPRSGARYDWRRYPGPTSSDGAGELVRVIRESAEPVTILSVCQVSTLAEALDRDPAIVDHSRVMSMSTSLRATARPSDSDPEAPTEWEAAGDANAAADADAYRRLLASGWDLTVAPTGVCAQAMMRGPVWERFLASPNLVARMIVRDYREWYGNNAGWRPDFELFDYTPDDQSSWLWDTVAVALALETPYLETEPVRLEMGADAIVRETPDGRPATAAIAWRDLEGFLDDLSRRVLAARA